MRQCPYITKKFFIQTTKWARFACQLICLHTLKVARHTKLPFFCSHIHLHQQQMLWLTLRVISYASSVHKKSVAFLSIYSCHHIGKRRATQTEKHNTERMHRIYISCVKRELTYRHNPIGVVVFHISLHILIQRCSKWLCMVINCS